MVLGTKPHSKVGSGSSVGPPVSRRIFRARYRAATSARARYPSNRPHDPVRNLPGAEERLFKAHSNSSRTASLRMAGIQTSTSIKASYGNIAMATRASKPRGPEGLGAETVLRPDSSKAGRVLFRRVPEQQPGSLQGQWICSSFYEGRPNFKWT